MKPIRPVFPAHDPSNATRLLQEGARTVVYAENHPLYVPLPVLRRVGDPTGQLVSRWRLTWRERLRVLLFGDLFVSVLTFGDALQPILPSTTLDAVTFDLRDGVK